jgi:hypothetical protein
MKILRIKVEENYDEISDTSYIGEFGSENEENAIDRRIMGVWKKGEYEYFYPADVSTPEMRAQSFWRMEEYLRGNWSLLEIRATAKIEMNDEVKIITSGCAHGIESDNDKDFIDQIKESELSELKSILRKIGFTDKEL